MAGTDLERPVPLTFDPGPSAFSPDALELLDGPDYRAWGDAMYGDFPHGADLRMVVSGGYGLQALEEADMRAEAWARLRDEAVVQGLSLGRFTWAEAARTLGISRQAAQKRYAHLLKPS